MGWLCTQCGTENRILENCCRGCLKDGQIKERMQGAWITLWERIHADQLGRFARIPEDHASEMLPAISNAVSRIGKIGAAAATMCAVLLVVWAIFTGGAEEAASPLARLAHQIEAAGNGIADGWNTVIERLVQRGYAIGLEQSIVPAEVIAQRLQQLCISAVQQAEETLGRGRYRLVRRTEMIVQELPQMDLHIVSWLINRSYELYGRLHGIGADWAANAVLTLCDYLAQLSGWLWSFRV